MGESESENIDGTAIAAAVSDAMMRGLLPALEEQGEVPVGFALVIALGVDERGLPEHYVVSGQMAFDETHDAARASSLALLANGLTHQLEGHPELRAMLPAIMEAIARATGGEVIKRDVPTSVVPASVARRAAMRRRPRGGR